MVHWLKTMSVAVDVISMDTILLDKGQQNKNVPDHFQETQ
jgi:hypothetical protein